MKTNTKFKQVGTYQYTSEAFIFKGKLESEGIEVFMRDNYTIDTDPLVSNAIGGVKLFVATDDFMKAKFILDSISDYALDKNGEAVICPKCKQPTAYLISLVDNAKSFFSLLVSLLLFVLPFYVSRKYKCDSCGNQFEINKK